MHLLFGFALLLASVTSFPFAESGTAQCGGLQVAWNNMRSVTFGVNGSAELTATAPDGSTVFDLAQTLRPGERLVPRWCGDVLGDGSQVLAYEMFSGGAHCCFSASVVSLSPEGRHLLDADLGNGGLGMPQQLTDSGPMALVASSDVFAYFDDLSFAASPFMPLIYAYDGQQYVESTRQFPDVIQADIDKANADLDAALARPPQPNVPPQFANQEQESVALRLYGLHWLLGDADTAVADLESRVSPDVAAWLDANAQAATDAMAQVYADPNSPTSASLFE
jgi:hypothetical protein